MKHPCEDCSNADKRDDACCRICPKYKAKIKAGVITEVLKVIEETTWKDAEMLVKMVKEI